MKIQLQLSNPENRQRNRDKNKNCLVEVNISPIGGYVGMRNNITIIRHGY